MPYWCSYETKERLYTDMTRGTHMDIYIGSLDSLYKAARNPAPIRNSTLYARIYYLCKKYKNAFPSYGIGGSLIYNMPITTTENKEDDADLTEEDELLTNTYLRPSQDLFDPITLESIHLSDDNNNNNTAIINISQSEVADLPDENMGWIY
jgi:hypothetical protein